MFCLWLCFVSRNYRKDISFVRHGPWRGVRQRLLHRCACAPVAVRAHTHTRVDCASPFFRGNAPAYTLLSARREVLSLLSAPSVCTSLRSLSWFGVHFNDTAAFTWLQWRVEQGRAGGYEKGYRILKLRCCWLQQPVSSESAPPPSTRGSLCSIAPARTVTWTCTVITPLDAHRGRSAAAWGHGVCVPVDSDQDSDSPVAAHSAEPGSRGPNMATVAFCFTPQPGCTTYALVLAANLDGVR